MNALIESFVNPPFTVHGVPEYAEKVKSGQDRGMGLYPLLDSGVLPKTDIGALVRDRYPETAVAVDIKFLDARFAAEKEQTPQTHNRLVQAIGLVGLFNYVRGITVFEMDGTIDREHAPKMMLSPSASVQVLEAAKLTQRDRVLELFSGVGYFSLFLAISQPNVLDCADKYTPRRYDLKKTFDHAFSWIYHDLPKDFEPDYTPPNFIEADCANLPDFNEQNGLYPQYNKVFLHPPYGRESGKAFDLKEAEAFTLWVESLNTLSLKNPKPFQAYSVVPSEWTEAVVEAKQKGKSKRETVDLLHKKIGSSPYYSKRGLRKAKVKDVPNWGDLLNAVTISQSRRLDETRMFDIDLVVT